MKFSIIYFALTNNSLRLCHGMNQQQYRKVSRARPSHEVNVWRVKASISRSSTNQYTTSKYSPVQRFFRSLLGLDIMEESLSDFKEELSDSKEELSDSKEGMLKRFDYIDNNMLRRSDMKELGDVAWLMLEEAYCCPQRP